MNACDIKSGCKAALFQTGVNKCYLIGTLGTTISNSTYNLGILSTASATSTSPTCTSATAVAVTFNELVATSYGDSIVLVGSIPQLGSWAPASGLALTADQYTSTNPLWSGTISLPPGTSVQYKYVKMGGDGTATWEADPDHSFVVPSLCSGAATVTQSASWQSS
jgi:hypothetical protein